MLTTIQISTFDIDRKLSQARGFFFGREGRLYLVTSRHVLFDVPSTHFPSRIEIEFHTDCENGTCFAVMSIPLYQLGECVWHRGRVAAGQIDVAVLELDRAALPVAAVFACLTLAHMQLSLGEIEVRMSLLLVGYPLGFQDNRHHLPVVLQAVIASSFGVRFQGKGYFFDRCAHAPWCQWRTRCDS